ncbi:MAG: response regulator transcription factor [Flavobacteriales bacterium]|nr:response regulator transcription factor [Flavobacteriales bacterium]
MSTTGKSKILLVEDDSSFGGLMRDFLKMNDLDVELCTDGEAGREAFFRDRFDLCILDVMMPKMDGFTLASEIKKFNPDIPVIFLTAKTLREDMVKGYKLGADDYITKPFDSEILLMKVNAILKRNTSQNAREKQTVFHIGDFEYKNSTRELVHPTAGIAKLSPKEGELLRMLLVTQDSVMPRSAALKAIWKDDNYFTGRSMDVYMTKLRKYLSHDPRIEIRNIHSEGFMLTVREE